VFGVAGVVDHEATSARFAPGQRVLVEGREAKFCYPVSAGAAVIRYEGQTATRVVPANKLAALPPSAQTPTGSCAASLNAEGDGPGDMQYRVAVPENWLR
jgi:hypothetical protein